MNTKQAIDTLWQEFRDAITQTYDQADMGSAGDDARTLRDYAEDNSMHDALASLLGREAANERQHRRSEENPKGFGIDSAAKLILMNCAERGAERDTPPPAVDVLCYRQTAVEACVIGFLVRNKLTQDWRKRLEALDYAKLMQS